MKYKFLPILMLIFASCALDLNCFAQFKPDPFLSDIEQLSVIETKLHDLRQEREQFLKTKKPEKDGTLLTPRSDWERQLKAYDFEIDRLERLREYYLSRNKNQEIKGLEDILKEKNKSAEADNLKTIHAYEESLKKLQMDAKNKSLQFEEWNQLYDDIDLRVRNNQKQIDQIAPKEAAFREIKKLEMLLDKTNNRMDRRVLVERIRESSNLQEFFFGLNLPNDQNLRRELAAAFREAKKRDQLFQENPTPPTDEERKQLEQLKNENNVLFEFIDELTSDLLTDDCQKCLQKINGK